MEEFQNQEVLQGDFNRYSSDSFECVLSDQIQSNSGSEKYLTEEEIDEHGND